MGGSPIGFHKVGLILRAIGFDNSTRIYLASGEFFGGDRFMKPFRGTRGMLGSTVEYMVCLPSDILLPTYDGPSNFSNNVMGYRLYHEFRTIIQPDRKDLAPIFVKREKGQTTDFEESVRGCFCQMNPKNTADKCPLENVVENLNSRLESEEGMRSSNMTDV
ncbi:hypothetical protein MKW98_022330 [Papaver atlanticum]|uniref:O-fucosyltransferase family protein n=1 Tax=Papaver atlanticum TaxID=357466 RepID=A0AAD4XR17_9MAGN|nr:hypothetical protein MKW98_022330 [Papaver atlanticum]